MSKTASETVPILCRLWQEDHVWNAVAERLPVAVSGHTFEEARDNLRDALEGHIRTLIEIDDFRAVFEKLLEHAHECAFLTLSELPPNSAFVPMQAALHNDELLVLA